MRINLRRSDKEVTDREEVEELLSNALVGRLGTCFDNIPYVTPVNFVYDKDKIIFIAHMKAGRLII